MDLKILREPTREKRTLAIDTLRKKGEKIADKGTMNLMYLCHVFTKLSYH